MCTVSINLDVVKVRYTSKIRVWYVLYFQIQEIRSTRRHAEISRNTRWVLNGLERISSMTQSWAPSTADLVSV